MTNKSVQLYGKTNDLQDETRQAHRDDLQFTGWLIQDHNDDSKEISLLITLIIYVYSTCHLINYGDIHSTKMG